MRGCGDPGPRRPAPPRMGGSGQLLRRGGAAPAHRHTMDVVYHVVEGTGSTIIEGVRFDWTEHDIFVVPKWALHEHVNPSKSADACLFSYNDRPVMESLGLYREEELLDNDGYQEV